jgi:hypothetical protein
MITYSYLGKNGRLGNQMFQYALLLGVQAKLGYNIVLNENIGAIQLLQCFDIKGCHFFNERDIFSPNKFEEHQFHFDKKVFRAEDHTDFKGYFQTERYFEHCRDKVRQEFTFKEEIRNRAEAWIEPYKQHNLVSLHVRRTDYVHLPNHHPLCTLDYYKAAIPQFPDAHFIIFSDDIEWCKENLQLENATFADTGSDYVDLCVMSMCNHHIIANSSFSWWGAWLNPSETKRVIAPKIWFGPAYFHWKTEDLYLPYFTAL